MEEKHRMKSGREEVLDTRTGGALWSSEAITESSHNGGVLDIGLDNPETGGDGSSAENVDVGIGKR